MVTSRRQPAEKPVEWVAGALDDLRACPDDVQDTFGYAIDLAQHGGRHPAAKPMKGHLRDVVEVIAGDRGSTWRVMYTVAMGGVVYVLHVFQKKSPHGIRTPRHELDLIVRRLTAARRHHWEHYA